MNAAEEIRGTRVHQDFARDFHKRNNDSRGVAFPKSSRELRKLVEFKIWVDTPAQSPLHTPVNGLHSIENAQLTNSFFSLTKKIQGVKHNCSLTVSEVFPVGAASGGQAKSP
jgi:hypothetical protein